METSPHFVLARQQRAEIHARLISENEHELASLLEKCGQEFILICTNCGHRAATETRCKQKWCPVCVRAIATKRSLKFAAGAAAMKWPLFLTLTVANVRDTRVPFVRKLRRDFGKLRHRNLWKHNVAGGVAAIEVTNLDHAARKKKNLSPQLQGWHPHLHALIDCKWLALSTPPPQPGSSRDEVRSRCRAAKRELTTLWKKITHEKHGICWLQRANGDTAAREVLKYSVKGSDLLASPDPIGPLIHQLRATRLTTSFGNLFGKKFEAPKQPKPCEQCGEFAEWLPQMVADILLRKAA